MAWYSSDKRILRRQVGLDAALLGWIAVWIALAVAAVGGIRGLTQPLRSAVRSVEALRDNIHQAAVGASGLPVGGGALHPPLDAASTDANSLVSALNDQIRAIELASTGVGVVLVLVPVALFLCWWLPRRLRTTRARAGASRESVELPAAGSVATSAVATASDGGVPEDRHADGAVSPERRLAALRSLVTADPAVLFRISEDPVTAWARGDRDVIAALDALDAASSSQRRE